MAIDAQIVSDIPSRTQLTRPSIPGRVVDEVERAGFLDDIAGVIDVTHQRGDLHGLVFGGEARAGGQRPGFRDVVVHRAEPGL